MNNYYARLIMGSLMIICFVAPFSASGQSGQVVSLNDLSFFKSPSANWSVAGLATADFNKPNTITKQQGTGILVNDPKTKGNEDITTVLEHGDIEVEMDFLMPKGSNSGIYLQGRYEIQLTDSWGIKNLTYQDNGAVYPRWDESRAEGQKGYQGTAPRLNMSKAPGLWQNIKIRFRAPKFDGNGKKTSNAQIEGIVLNGVSIIENVDLTGPTRGAAFDNESATGPLKIQGNHGPIAFKNIKYHVPGKIALMRPSGTDPTDPIILSVERDPMIMRSFVDFHKDPSQPAKKITHAASVGFPQNIGFSFDLNKGSVFQVWKGGFLDVTPMWNTRGNGTSKAIGSKILLEDSPSFGVLASATSSWIDTLSADTYRSKGYELDGQGYPTFKYTIYNVNVEDRAYPQDDGKVLTRELVLAGGNLDNLYYRLAKGKNIMALDNGMYSINNAEYYLQFTESKQLKPILRNSGNGQELLIPVKNLDKGVSISYSLIW